MDILSYFKSLVTVVKKSAVLEDGRVTEQELKQKVIPAWEEAVKQFRGKAALQSTLATEKAKIYARMVGGTPKNMPEEILDRLKRLHGIMGVVRVTVEHSFEDVMVADGMSVAKLNVIKIMETGSFLSRYSLHFLNYLYVVETAEQMGDDTYIKDHISKGQLQWIEENFITYCQLSAALCIKPEQVSKLLAALPETHLGMDPQAATSMLGEKVVNPLGVMGFSPTTSNPIYHFRLFIAEYQANRYKEAVELKTTLELRLLNLRRRQDGHADAKLEADIQYTQGRLDRVSEEIREVEEQS